MLQAASCWCLVVVAVGLLLLLLIYTVDSAADAMLSMLTIHGWSAHDIYI